MQRKNHPGNLWPLLVVPVAGAVILMIRRFVGNRASTTKESSRADEQAPVTVSRGAGAAATIAGQGDLSPGHALRSHPADSTALYILLVPFLILATAVAVLALHHIPVQSQSIVQGGIPERGRADLQTWGCGSCHSIPGVTGANGKVGPALDGLSSRSFIAGRLQNTPDNMILWIMHPQQVSPGNDMPDTGVPENVARDMAAYLYSTR